MEALHTGKLIAKWATILTILEYISIFALMLFTLIIISNLGPANYGVFAIAAAYYPIFLILPENIINLPLTRLISSLWSNKSFKKVARLIGFSILYVLLLVIALLSIYQLLVSYILINIYNRPEIVHLSSLLGFMIFFYSYASLVRSIIFGLKKFKYVAVLRIINATTYIVCIFIIVLLYNWSVRSVIIGLILHGLTYFVFAIMLLLYLIRNTGLSIVLNFRREYFREITKEGSYFIAGSSLYNLFTRIDIAIMPLFVSDVMIGYYSFAKNLVIRLRVIFNKLNSILYPIFSGYSSEDSIGIAKKLLRYSYHFSILYSAPIAFFLLFFSRDVILFIDVFISVRSYLDSAIYLGLFSLLLLTFAISSIIVSFYTGIGKLDKLLKANSMLIVSGLILIYSLTEFFGALGTTIGYITSQYFSVSYWLMSARRDGLLSLNELFKSSLIAVMLSMVMKLSWSMVSGFIGYLLGVPLIFIIYLTINTLIYMLLDIISENDLIIMLKISRNKRSLSKIVMFMMRIYKAIKKDKRVENARETIGISNSSSI